MPRVMVNNYLLANEFENNEHKEEMMEENKEVACTLECGEGTSAADQVIHSNDEEEDDGMTDIEEEIDLEAEQQSIHQEGNSVMGLLGKPFGRSFNYYVLYGTPTRKKIVPQSKKYRSPPIIVPLYTGWKDPSRDIIQFEEVKGTHGKEILQVGLSDDAEAEENKENVEVNTKEMVVFKRPSIKLTKHLRPLYVKALINGIPKFRSEINKVDCLEKRNSAAKELKNGLERIAKPGYAQAQDPLTKINVGDEEEHLPSFFS
ncbi:hypothetical protein Adt_05254 [Abeliophyllum distichum]|uniref:Uncharacterized protein n=1 Tax=Abeliophyllum distichum TaxID=126358 RepID=A0ABD1V5P3_9LAMI